MKRGRPTLVPDSPSMKVTISLPVKQFEAFCMAAFEQQVSLPEVIRRALDPPAEKNPKK
jgi:hypothetical protein